MLKGLDYGTNGMDGTMNPKIYGTSDVDYASSETPGAAFQPTDPFSETHLDSYTVSFRVQEVQDEDSWLQKSFPSFYSDGIEIKDPNLSFDQALEELDRLDSFFGSEDYTESEIQDGFNPGPLVSQPEISVDDR